MKKLFGLIFILILFIASHAEAMEFYNCGEKVNFKNELLFLNDDYFVCIDDLSELGLSVEESEKRLIISSNDYFGVERQIRISEYTDLTKTFNIVKRSKEKINEPHISTDFLDNEIIFFKSDNYTKKYNDKNYISLNLIGQYLSHKYNVSEDKSEFYIANKNSVMIEVTVKFTDNKEHSVEIYTGEELSERFDVFTKNSLTVCGNETFCIEIPAEKIQDNIFYLIVDSGEKYEYIKQEFDFSKVSDFIIYENISIINYEATINLPEIAEEDVAYTVYLDTDKGDYSKRGIIKKGELSANTVIENITVFERYTAKVIFDSSKYYNGYLRLINYNDDCFRSDIQDEYTTKLSKKVVCNIKLPDDYSCEYDVEIKVSLENYNSNSIIIDSELCNYDDKVNIILNKQNPNATVVLYGRSDELKLMYEITNPVQGLSQIGYLSTDGNTINSGNKMRIKDNISADITLLKSKSVTINVLRPEGVFLENDIYATVDIIPVSSLYNKVLDFTEVPLIKAGEMAGSFSFEVIENNMYSIEINDISGDENILSYCYLTQDGYYQTNRNKKQKITFNDENLSLELIKCFNISGTVKNDLDNPGFNLTVDCECENGESESFKVGITGSDFKINIPDFCKKYTLNIKTSLGLVSYYVENEKSSDKAEDATVFYNTSDKNDICIEYLPYKPKLPVEISYTSNYLYFKNISDYTVKNYTVYIAIYDSYERLVSVKTYEYQNLLRSRTSKTYLKKSSFYGNKAKIFVFISSELTPLADIYEI